MFNFHSEIIFIRLDVKRLTLNFNISKHIYDSPDIDWSNINKSSEYRNNLERSKYYILFKTLQLNLSLS